MRLIGLIGGITWQSTIMYYEVLNRLAASHDSDLSSARCLIHSLEFGEVARLQKENKWDLLDGIMIEAAQSLERGGASLILICANTMHLCVDAIRSKVSIPVIHIAEVTAKHILKDKLSRVALLGTKYTMERAFFKDILQAYGIEAVIPNESERIEIHRVIYKELADGILLPSSKRIYIEIINRLQSIEVEGVILGCTELPLLIKPEDVDIPIYDTTTLHATAGFSMAVNGGG